MKKYATFNENGYKTAGYLEDYPDIPADAIEITDEEETLYNNGYIRVDGKAVKMPSVEPKEFVPNVEAIASNEISKDDLLEIVATLGDTVAEQQEQIAELQEQLTALQSE